MLSLSVFIDATLHWPGLKDALQPAILLYNSQKEVLNNNILLTYFLSQPYTSLELLKEYTSNTKAKNKWVQHIYSVQEKLSICLFSYSLQIECIMVHFYSGYIMNHALKFLPQQVLPCNIPYDAVTIYCMMLCTCDNIPYDPVTIYRMTLWQYTTSSCDNIYCVILWQYILCDPVTIYTVWSSDNIPRDHVAIYNVIPCIVTIPYRLLGAVLW